VHPGPPCAKTNMFLKGIETLARHAFDSTSLTTSQNALRCLANAMFLKPDTRQIFIDLGYEAKACDKLKNDNRDDEFLASRILLLSTYAPNINLETLVDQYHVAERICTNLNRHARQYTTEQKGIKGVDPMGDMALSETLKLVYNLTQLCPQRRAAFSPALPHILMLLDKRDIPSTKPLDPPISLLINSLLNLPLEHEDNVNILFPKATPSLNTDRLIEILDKSTKVYADVDLETLVSPLVALIHKVYVVATQAAHDAKQNMEKALLPNTEDRKQPLGRGESLSARLLRLSADHTAPQASNAVSTLLFELSGNDVRTFVHNIGYGYASGFLVRHKIPMPEDITEARSGSGDESANINPITGQTLESEPTVEMPAMTDEEKEREAERLFVLFERYSPSQPPFLDRY